MFENFSSSGIGLVGLVAVIWLATGVLLSIVMGRRGHNGFGWLVMGTLLGPFGVALAVDAGRHGERLEPQSVPGPASAAGTGPVDVLFGSDGSPESATALAAALALLGDRLGRLTLATVVPFGDVTAPERRAKAALRLLRDRAPASDLEVLHGHPSAALRQFAAEGGYGLIVVGSRGRGLTNALLGSAADELSHHSEIPVLVVGERQRVADRQPVGAGRQP
jgi:nucleotide-binding universal stress UspA family protein